MEDKTSTVVTEATTTKEVDTKSGEKAETKTFTQEELNAIIEERLAKAKKGIPSKEELEEFAKYKESIKTKEEKDKETIEDLTNTKNENLTLKQERAIFKKGIVDDDTVEFIQFKVSKLEGDFNENLDKFLADNPKYLTKEQTKKPDTTGQRQTASVPQNEKEAYLSEKYKKNPYFKG